MICPFAFQRPGPAVKTNAGKRVGKGAVLHSAEGSLASMLNVLANVDPPLENRVSWHFSVTKNGGILQHHDSMEQCWHARATGNTKYVGIEHEGKAGEPLTELQLEASVKLVAWLAEVEQWEGFTRKKTLWEHNELGVATACPSHRIPWDEMIRRLEADTLSEAEREELDRLRIDVALYQSRERIFKAVYNGDALFRPKVGGAEEYVRLTPDAPIIEPED